MPGLSFFFISSVKSCKAVLAVELRYAGDIAYNQFHINENELRAACCVCGAGVPLDK